jgi:hypothetical protein
MKNTKESEVQLPDGVTPEMIKAWKERYGEQKVKLALLPKDDAADEFLQVIVRVPDRKAQAEFEKWIDKSPDKAKDILINACLLTNKDVVKADDDLYLGAFDAIAKLLPIRTAIIKNL